MTVDIALTLSIIVFALLLFATERLRVDVVALLVLITVAALGLVSPEQVFDGFANPAVITVWAVYIVSGGMLLTGVAERMGQLILRLAGPGRARLTTVIMVACGVMSAFVNNVGATAMLMPAVLGISRKTGVSASKLLIPLSFSSLLGGTMTLVGTPANILATGILASKGLETFGFFEFTPIGLVALATGVLFMVTAGAFLLPDRVSPDERKAEYWSRSYVSEVRVRADGELAGRTLLESRLGADYDLAVVGLVRAGLMISALHAEFRIEAEDLLLVEGGADNLLRAASGLGLSLEERHEEIEHLEEEESRIVEATLAPRSRMVGRSLQDMHFRDRFGFTTLAIYRHGEAITRRLRDVKLEFGDALLLRGPRHRVASLYESDEFLILEPIAVSKDRAAKAPLALLILGLVLVMVVGFKIHIAMGMVVGAVAMVLTGCLSMDEAYESIDWRTVFLVAGMLPLGMAMEETGTARYLADMMLSLVGGFGPLAVLAGVYLLAALITQPMSNAAAIVLVVPIAIDTAAGMGASHLSFTMAAIVGAATSFLTPVGHKANVLVFGPGGYKFFDYARVGLPLTVLLFVVSMVAIPYFFPLFP